MDIINILIGKANVFYDFFIDLSKQSPVLAGVISFWGLGVITFIFLRIPSQIYGWIKRQLTTDLDLNNQDDIYYMFLKWLSTHKMHTFVRTFNLSHNNYWGNGQAFMTYGYGRSVFLFHGWPIFIRRARTEASATIHSKETICLTVLGRNTKLLGRLFEEIKVKDETDVTYHAYTYKDSGWNRFATVPNRSFYTLSLPKVTKDALLKHLDDFTNEKEWYTKNGITYKTGILLHGPPGTGKTSIVSCICSDLKKNCYILNLSNMGDSSLKEAFASVPPGAVILLEDIDTVFSKRNHKRLLSTEVPRRDNIGSNAPQEPRNEDQPNAPSESSIIIGGVTLGGLLNALDGIACGTDRIVFATTNFYEKLDDALIREGRFDLTLNIYYMTDETLRDYMCRLYPNFPRREANKWHVSKEIAPCKVQQLVFENRSDPYAVLKKVATEKIQANNKGAKNVKKVERIIQGEDVRG